MLDQERKKERTRVYWQAYYKDNKEKILAKNRAWIKANPEKNRANVKRCKAKKNKDESRYHLCACARTLLSDFTPETTIRNKMSIKQSMRM